MSIAPRYFNTNKNMHNHHTHLMAAVANPLTRLLFCRIAIQIIDEGIHIVNETRGRERLIRERLDALTPLEDASFMGLLVF